MMTKTLTLKVEMRELGFAKPYPRNAKKHPPEQIKRLAATIRTHGWDQPIVVWTDGTIIKGHGRRLAAYELGLTDSDLVPMVVRSDLTEAEADAARIADNASAGLQYDTEMMREEIRRLIAEDADLDLDGLALTEKERSLLTEDLGVPELDAIMADTESEIEKQKEEDAERVARADEAMVPLGKAMGFSKLRKADERVLMAFMAEAEAASGKQGYDAFIEGMRLAAERGLA